MPDAAARDALVDRLASIEAIRQVVFRYAAAIDQRDKPRLLTCFHPDSEHEHGDFKGASADFCTFAMSVAARCTVTHHLIGNVSIDVDGDHAASEAYFWAYHHMPADAEPVFASARPNDDVIIAGRYIDRFERREGEWRIARRCGLRDWWRIASCEDRGNGLVKNMGFAPAGFGPPPR